MGLMPVLLLLRAVELPGRGLSVSVPLAVLVAVSSILASVGWLEIMTGLRMWRRKSMPSASAVCIAGLSLSYLVLPVTHYDLSTPPAYRYITTASNFFAFDVGLQMLVFVVAAGLAASVTRVRQKLVIKSSNP
jgi:hypothetical protein